MCGPIPSTKMSNEELKQLEKKSLGERHIIMQNKAQRCIDNKLKKRM